MQQDEPWELESQLISQLDLSLNLDQNRHNAFHSRLKELRAQARQRARDHQLLGRRVAVWACLAGRSRGLLSELRERVLAMQDALFELPETPPEHAVIARFQLGGDDLGEPDQWSLVFAAERSMAAAVTAAGIGEVDGNEFGGGEVVIYAYGPDAEALFRVMEPGLRMLPFRPAHVVLRYGEPGDDVVSERIEL